MRRYDIGTELHLSVVESQKACILQSGEQNLRSAISVAVIAASLWPHLASAQAPALNPVSTPLPAPISYLASP
jgi:hypothetical protein